jgi:hypothetical protein
VRNSQYHGSSSFATLFVRFGPLLHDLTVPVRPVVPHNWRQGWLVPCSQ